MPTPSCNSSTNLFDPASIEARLNALTGPPTDDLADDVNREPDLQQQLLADESLTFLESRSVDTDEEGHTETLLQLYRVSVLPHQSRLVVHASFRPDLRGLPHIEASVIDRQARVRVTRVEIFGTRIEISLTNPLPVPSNVCLEIIATSTNGIDD